MSFEEQERALFHLLFDDQLRKHFCERGVSALGQFQLESGELDDFTIIKPAALEMDSSMRTKLILSQFCRSYPMSFSLLSSFEGGLDGLKMLIDVTTMQANPMERVAVFGRRLKQIMANTSFDTDAEHALLLSLLDTELGMASTAASLRGALESGTPPQSIKTEQVEGWETRQLRFAFHVSATMIPCPLNELKDQLGLDGQTDVWRQLNQTPLCSHVRVALSHAQDHRFLVCRAEVNAEVGTYTTLCEPPIEHRTVELSSGFAQLLQHINGQMSVDFILQKMQEAGAAPKLLHQIKEGFLTLITAGMLQIEANSP